MNHELLIAQLENVQRYHTSKYESPWQTAKMEHFHYVSSTALMEACQILSKLSKAEEDKFEKVPWRRT